MQKIPSSITAGAIKCSVLPPFPGKPAQARYFELKGLPTREALRLINRLAQQIHHDYSKDVEHQRFDQRINETLATARALTQRVMHTAQSLRQLSAVTVRGLPKRRATSTGSLLASRLRTFQRNVQLMREWSPDAGSLVDTVSRLDARGWTMPTTASAATLAEDLFSIWKTTSSMLWDRLEQILLVKTGTFHLNSVGAFAHEEEQARAHEKFGAGIDYEVGPFYISFLMRPNMPIDRGDYKPFGITMYVQDTWQVEVGPMLPREKRTYWGHPHVSGSSLCCGDMTVSVRKAGWGLNWQYVYDIVTALLRGYSPKDCYDGRFLPDPIPAPHIYSPDTTYPMPNALREAPATTRCTSCFASTRLPDSYECSECENRVCANCAQNCEECGSINCYNHSRSCVVCQGMGEPGRLCYVSSDNYCGSVCAECSGAVCTDHMDSEWTDICENCANDRRYRAENPETEDDDTADDYEEDIVDIGGDGSIEEDDDEDSDSDWEDYNDDEDDDDEEEEEEEEELQTNEDTNAPVTAWNESAELSQWLGAYSG